jgi:hypothetical protein
LRPLEQRVRLEKIHNEFLRHGMPPAPLLRELLLADPRLWDRAL